MSARRVAVLATTLVVLPTLLLAQRRGSSGGGGGGGSGGTGVRNKIETDPVREKKELFSTKDLQKENMVNFVLDKKKDLKLSDDEVKALKDLNDRARDTVSGQYKSLDSISGELKRDGDRRMAGVFAPQYVAEIRARYDVFTKLALTKLSDEHQKAANDLIEARRKELAPPPSDK